MNRFLKGIWNLGAIMFFAWLGFKALGMASNLLGFPSLCEYTNVAEIKSPDGKKIAKLGYSDCGATTNWQTGINIVDVETGKEFNGLFGIDGKPEDLSINWESNQKLVLSNFSIEHLLWFNQDYSSGVKLELK